MTGLGNPIPQPFPSRDNFVACLYLSELDDLCRFALNGFVGVANYVQRWLTARSPDPGTETQHVWVPTHAMLTTAATIHWFLFGEGVSRRRRATTVMNRCRTLRTVLGLTEDSYPEIRNLTVRHGFQHLDERMDEIFAPLVNGEGPIRMVRMVVSSVSSRDVCLRRIDPDTLTLWFNETESINLNYLAREIRDVEERILNRGYSYLSKNEIHLFGESTHSDA